jgi:hypothetical protein
LPLLKLKQGDNLEVVRCEEVVDVGAVVVVPAALLGDGPPLPWRGRAVPGGALLLLPGGAGGGRPAPRRAPVNLAIRVAPLLERETHDDASQLSWWGYLWGKKKIKKTKSEEAKACRAHNARSRMGSRDVDARGGGYIDGEGTGWPES